MSAVTHLVRTPEVQIGRKEGQWSRTFISTSVQQCVRMRGHEYSEREMPKGSSKSRDECEGINRRSPVVYRCFYFVTTSTHFYPASRVPLTRRSTAQGRGCTGQRPRGTTYDENNVLVKSAAKVVKTETYRAISFSALSTESEPWQMLRPTARAKSPRIVPGRVHG